MASYSQDLRDRVLRGLERGETPTVIARRLEVSVRWVAEVKSRYEKHGERSSRQVGGYRESCVKAHEATIRGWLRAREDLTLAQMCEKLAVLGVQIKGPALWHQLDKWNLTFKKNPARQRARARGRGESARRVEGKSAHA